MKSDNDATAKVESDLEGLVYSVMYDLSRFEYGPIQQIGVMYHTDFKGKPRVIAIRPYPIEAVQWVPDKGLYYTCKNDVWHLWDSQGKEIDRHIQKGKEPVCVLAWVPGFGLCSAGREGVIRRSTNEKGLPSIGVIAERPGRVYSLLWIPERGLFDAGCRPEYHQIRKCLDKDANKTDELVAERLGAKSYRTGDYSWSLPTLCWAPTIGLLDNGGFFDPDKSLVRYLDETGNKCSELLAIKEGNLAYVDAFKYENTCRLGRHQFGIDHPITTAEEILDWAEIPGQGLLYAGKSGIYKLLDEKGTLVEDKKPVISTHPHQAIAMTGICNR